MVRSKGNKIYINSDMYYTVYRLKKRLIYTPCDELKHQQVYFLNAMRWHFPLKIDTLSCAKPHAGKKWVLKMDIKHFYESVPYCDIVDFVNLVCKKIPNANVNHYLELTTLNCKLPTGAPTSAHIANNCFKEIDLYIKSYCGILGVQYSRYMDDLTFSSDSKAVLKNVEKRMKEVLFLNGYTLNTKKLKYVSDNKQQNVLGLVVNGGKVRIDNTKKREIIAMLHSYVVSKSETTYKDLRHRVWDYAKEKQLEGYISYIKHVDREYYERLQKYTIKLLIKHSVSVGDIKCIKIKIPP